MEAVCVETVDHLDDMPQIYRDLLVRQVMVHTEGELSGADDYVTLFYAMAPNAYEKRICCERAAEEVDHFMRGAKVLAEMGIDVSHLLEQDLSERKLYATEAVKDIRTWEERALFSFLGEAAVLDQLTEMAESSYRPLAAIFPKIIRDEHVHVAHGHRITRSYCKSDEGRAKIQTALATWWPRTLDLFGTSTSQRSRLNVEWGLRKYTNEEARNRFIAKTRPLLEGLGLDVPSDVEGRKFL
jgi:ring-1,2-phenylacetyl-CoA epoxidase subunit PaaA